MKITPFVTVESSIGLKRSGRISIRHATTHATTIHLVPPTAVGISGNGHAFLTQRGNTSVAPVLVFNTATGVLVASWGKADVGISTVGTSKTSVMPLMHTVCRGKTDC